ncbi:MAG: TetR/AcrR family transcriptional regulator [Aristaeellaceae bacterium]
MRKGETKRQEMLAAAETLFLTRGYDATSVQDILDMLHASKGGFYHHFASKEEVLKLLCAQRAERAAACTEQQLEAAQGSMARINAVLHGFMPLRREEEAFIRMLMPLIERVEGRTMGMIYQDALVECFLPLLEREIAAAAQEGAVCPPVRGMESAVLQLVNHCWMELAASESASVRQGLRMDTAALLATLERYRRAIEVLLDAPYGSIVIISIQELDEVARNIRR